MADRFEREPRWPALVAMLAAGSYIWHCRNRFRWVPVGYCSRLSSFCSSANGVLSPWRSRLARILTFVANGAITLALIASLVFLIYGMAHHRNTATALLRAAGTLWFTNILVFALWYWKLDAGGPSEARACYRSLG